MKKIKLLGLFILSAIVIASIVYSIVNKEVDDLSSKSPDITISMTKLAKMIDIDSIASKALVDKIILIQDAQVKSIEHDHNSTVIELNHSESSSSIICQIDSRYIDDFAKNKANDLISIKGRVSAFTIDTDLGLGNQLELTYCTKP